MKNMLQFIKKMSFALAILLGIFLFCNDVSAQVPNFGRPGCAKDIDPDPVTVVIEYYYCWNCPTKPGNLGCYGDCARACDDAVQGTLVSENVWQVTAYNTDGTVNSTFQASGWTETDITLDGVPGNRMTFYLVP